MNQTAGNQHGDYPTAPIPCIAARMPVEFHKPGRRPSSGVLKPSTLLAVLAVLLVGIQTGLGDVHHPGLVLLGLLLTVVLVAGTALATIHARATLARLTSQAMRVAVVATQAVVVLGALPHLAIQVLNLAIAAAAFWTLRDS